MDKALRIEAPLFPATLAGSLHPRYRVPVDCPRIKQRMRFTGLRHMRLPCRGTSQRPAHVKERYPRRLVPRGDGAPKSAILWLSLRHAGASRRASHGRLPASGPALVRSVALDRADRSFSQLLAGTPSGPGGSSDAARVPRCDEAARAPHLRPASRRLMIAPLSGRGGVHDTRGLEGGELCGHRSGVICSLPSNSTNRASGYPA